MQRLTRRTSFVAAAAVVALLAACGSDGDGNAQTSAVREDAGEPSTTIVDPAAPSTEPSSTTEAPTGDPEVVAVEAGTAEEPIQLLPRPGDDGVLWLAERPGRIRRVPVADDGTFAGDGEVVLDITDETSVDSERGLLSFAFSPDGDAVHVSSTDLDGNTRIETYPVGADGTVDDAAGEVLFAIAQPYSNHNGGHVAIGPDGQLWLGLGDGGAGDDPENRAQDPGTELGKVIRIDPDGGDTEIVISGVRNPWRWAFDVDGSLWIADVGQNAIEEIDHLAPGEIDGANLGWSGFEGTEPYLDGDGRRPADAIGPVFQYPHTDGNCSITGGFVYRGSAIPALDGWYLFADYCAGRVRAIVLGDDGTFARELDLGIDVTSPISFGRDAQGEPYVLSDAGQVLRLAPA